MSPDEKFLGFLQFLERNFDTTRVPDFIYMLLTCVALPQYINTYSFLVSISKHDLQRVYTESNLTRRLQGLSDIFSDFVNKMELWSKLEQQYDFKSD